MLPRQLVNRHGIRTPSVFAISHLNLLQKSSHGGVPIGADRSPTSEAFLREVNSLIHLSAGSAFGADTHRSAAAVPARYFSEPGDFEFKWGQHYAGVEQIYYSKGSGARPRQETCSTHAIATGVGHCNASLLVLAQRRDAIPYVPSGLSDAIEVAIIRQFGRYPPSAVDDQAIRLRATHQLVEGARIKKDETRWTAFGDRPAWMIA